MFGSETYTVDAASAMGPVVAPGAFTPWTALMGGVCIGMLSAGKTLITGRILGISGAIKCVLNKPEFTAACTQASPLAIVSCPIHDACCHNLKYRYENEPFQFVMRRKGCRMSGMARSCCRKSMRQLAGTHAV